VKAAASRRVFLLTSVVAVTACGITAVGEYIESTNPPRDGGPDGPFLLPDGAPLGDGDVPDAPDATPPVTCADVCEAGSCDAGTCVLECTDAAAPCFLGDLKCPSGVPCAATCAVKDGCKLGVDCTQATRCDIACTGEGSCAGGVKCVGSTCNVDCTGAAGACDLGVQCDAVSCAIACGKDDCNLGPVTCSGVDCSIACGLDGSAGEKNGCKGPIRCTASNSCLIDCLSDGTCTGGVNVATDGGARVHCLGATSCKTGGVDVRARDASILCGAADSCEGTVTCRDAGACAFDCKVTDDKAISVCCPSGGCRGDSGACTNRVFECK
jgi:hypothetical protein